MRDDVEKFTAAHGVVHDVAVWAHPHGAVRRVDIARHGLGRCHAAPADAAGEVRRGGAEQAFPHHRMNTVGADDDVGLDRIAVGKACDRSAVTAFDRDAAAAVVQVRGLERIRQDVEQVGAMHREVRRTEFLMKIRAARARDVAAAPPVANVQKIRSRRDRAGLVLDAERAQRLDGVGREVETGADLAQRCGLLVDDDFGVPPFQRQRRGKPADAAADDGDAWRARHLCSSLLTNLQAGPWGRDCYDS